MSKDKTHDQGSKPRPEPREGTFAAQHASPPHRASADTPPERLKRIKEAGSLSTPPARSKPVDPDTVEKRSSSYATPPPREAPKPQSQSDNSSDT